MGVQQSKINTQLPNQPVLLHVYDATERPDVQCLNNCLAVLAMGIFHCGIEVYGSEYSFRKCTFGTGVFRCQPRQSEGHTFCESVYVGMTGLSQVAVQHLIKLLENDWPGNAFDVMKCNCCHFCERFSELLGTDGLPMWVKNMTETSACIKDKTATCFDDHKLNLNCGCSTVGPHCQEEDFEQGHYAPTYNSAQEYDINLSPLSPRSTSKKG